MYSLMSGLYILQQLSVIAFLWLVTAVMLPDMIGGCGTFTSAPPTCPGDYATFHCSVLSTLMDDVTQWAVKVNESETICFLSHNTGADDIIAMCGPENMFRAQREMIIDSCFSSSLTVMATSEVNEAFIRCVSSENGNGSLKVIGPPRSILFNISKRNVLQTSVSSTSVVLHWKVDGDNISRSVVTSNPALPCYGVNMTECEVREGKRELNETVQFGVEYSITVRADNCGGRQNGTESDTLQLLLKVPGEISGFSVNPVYSNTSGTLTDVSLTWDKVNDPVVKGVQGVNGRVLSYTVTITSTDSFSGLPLTLEVSSSECVDRVCGYLFNATDTAHLLPSSLNVSVRAFNAIGAGPPSSPVEVSTNNFLAVSIKRSESSIGWQLTCSLLSGFPAGVNASCRVAFGTDPSFTSLPYSASSTGEAAANGSVIVSISERLNSSTTYYYRVTAIEGDNHVVTVLGSFITGLFNCDKMDLVPDEHNVSESGTSTGCTGDQLVFASEGSMSLRGVVCYTGTSPGSTAVYSASPGCALSQESRVRTCMDNGLWSGAPAVVVSRGLSGSELGEVIAGVVFFLVGVALLVSGTVILGCRWKVQGAAFSAGCKGGKFPPLKCGILWISLTVLAVLLVSALIAGIVVIVCWITDDTECRTSKHSTSILAAFLLSLCSALAGIAWVVVVCLLPYPKAVSENTRSSGDAGKRRHSSKVSPERDDDSLPGQRVGYERTSHFPLRPLPPVNSEEYATIEFEKRASASSLDRPRPEGKENEAAANVGKGLPVEGRAEPYLAYEEVNLTPHLKQRGQSVDTEPTSPLASDGLDTEALYSQPEPKRRRVELASTGSQISGSKKSQPVQLVQSGSISPDVGVENCAYAEPDKVTKQVKPSDDSAIDPSTLYSDPWESKRFPQGGRAGSGKVKRRGEKGSKLQKPSDPVAASQLAASMNPPAVDYHTEPQSTSNPPSGFDPKATYTEPWDSKKKDTPGDKRKGKHRGDRASKKTQPTSSPVEAVQSQSGPADPALDCYAEPWDALSQAQAKAVVGKKDRDIFRQR